MAAKHLAAALTVHGALIAERLEPRMAAVLEEGEAMRLLPVIKPPKTAPGVTVDPEGWAEYLQPALDDFSRHLDQLGDRSEDEVEVVSLKKKALAVFDRTYRKVVGLAELFYQLAGLDRLAGQLRYGTGRPPEQA